MLFYNDFRFWLIIFIIIIFFLWLFFGGREHEFIGLRALDPNEKTTFNFQTEENLRQEYVGQYLKYHDNSDGVLDEIDSKEEEQGEIETVVPHRNICPTPLYYEQQQQPLRQPTFRAQSVRNFDSKNLNIDSKTFGDKLKMELLNRNKNDKDSKGEMISRLALESIYKTKFPKARPDFLKNPETNYNLELDGYCEDLQIAFEYQGIQHYTYPNRYHKSEEEFRHQVKKDKFKLEICDKSGIYLITIPYNVPHNQIYNYIVERLPENIRV